MLIVVVLNGWSASVRKRETRTSALVERLTRDRKRTMLTAKASLLRSQARRCRDFILDHQERRDNLLLVGKSLGARNLIRVLNALPRPLKYRKKALVTVDPCWPLLVDWRPNLNRTILKVVHPVELGANLVAVRPQDKQAGAMVSGRNIKNIPVAGVDHYSIVESPVLVATLADTIVRVTR